MCYPAHVDLQTGSSSIMRVWAGCHRMCIIEERQMSLSSLLLPVFLPCMAWVPDQGSRSRGCQPYPCSSGCCWSCPHGQGWPGKMCRQQMRHPGGDPTEKYPLSLGRYQVKDKEAAQYMAFIICWSIDTKNSGKIICNFKPWQIFH